MNAPAGNAQPSGPPPSGAPQRGGLLALAIDRPVSVLVGGGLCLLYSVPFSSHSRGVGLKHWPGVKGVFVAAASFALLLGNIIGPLLDIGAELHDLSAARDTRRRFPPTSD